MKEICQHYKFENCYALEKKLTKCLLLIKSLISSSIIIAAGFLFWQLSLSSTVLAQISEFNFYIATNGNDSNPGTLDKPFASLERARDAVRTNRSAHPLIQASLMNGVSWTNGKSGKALGFNGVNNYVDVGTHSILNITGDLTVGAWVKLQTAGAGTSRGFISRMDHLRNGYSLYIGTDNYFRFEASDGSAISAYSNISYTDTNWHYVVGVRSSGVNYLYIDGVKQTKTATCGIKPSSLDSLVIGKLYNDWDDFYMNGFIDELRIYNLALTADEVFQIYNFSDPFPPTNGLIRYFRFDEGSGSTTQDFSQGENRSTHPVIQASLMNGVSWTNGRSGKALGFNGVNNYVDVGTHSILNITGDLTVGAWVKLQTAGAGTFRGFISRMDHLRNGYSLYIGADNHFRFEASDGSEHSAYSNVPYIDTNWHYVVGVRSSGVNYLYIDGVKQTKTATGGIKPSSLDSLVIGRLYNNWDRWYMNGFIDELRIYNLALTADEVFQIYDFSNPFPPTKGLIRYFRFDEGSGSTTQDVSQSENSSGATIWIRSGTYQRNRTFGLTIYDSGTTDNPIIYQSYNDEEVLLTGGKQVTGFSKVTNSAILSRLSTDAKNKVFQVNLRDQGITDFVEDFADGTGLELFFNNERMTLSRYPNTGWERIADTPAPTGKSFAYSGDRPKNWATISNIWVHGFFGVEWSSAYLKVTSINKTERVITTDKTPEYGIAKYRRFYYLNVLEELDQPGEFYIDRNTGILYFWAPSDINNGKAYISLLKDPLISVENASDLILRGLTIEMTQGQAINVNTSNHIVIDQCNIRNIGMTNATISSTVDNYAVSFDNSLNSGISRSHLSQLAGGGVYLDGGDRITLTSSNNFVLNNQIHDYCRWYRSHRYALIIFDDVGALIAHNLIYNAPHTAILMYDGNENIIEFNEIFNVCTETTDAGAIYLNGGWFNRGNIIRYNYLHDISNNLGEAVIGIYLDNGASESHIYSNIFYMVSWSIQVNGGRDNTIANNVFVDSIYADLVITEIMERFASRVPPGYAQQRYNSNDSIYHFQEPPWSVNYPELINLLNDEPNKAKGNKFLYNIHYGSSVWASLFDNLLFTTSYLTFRNNWLVGDPSFVDYANKNFQLQSNSPVWTSGFQRIPIEQISVTSTYKGQQMDFLSTIFISSNPSGAKVFLYGNYGYIGEYKGVTPITIYVPHPKYVGYVVSLAIPGYESSHNLVKETIQTMAELSVTLTKSIIPKYNTWETLKDTNGNPLYPSTKSSAPFVVDWDIDGNKDIIISDATGEISYYENTGTDKMPLFGNKIKLLSGLGTDIATFVVDWNNDGKKDLLVGNGMGKVTLYLNTGTDAVSIFNNYINIVNVGNFAIPWVVDWNNDNKKDLLVGNGNGTISLFINFGTDSVPLFATPIQVKINGATFIVESGYASPCVVDWDADGKKDLLVGCKIGKVYFCRNIGKDDFPIFTSSMPIKVDGIDLAVSGNSIPFVVDWDNDNIKNLIIGSKDGHIYLYSLKSLISAKTTPPTSPNVWNIVGPSVITLDKSIVNNFGAGFGTTWIAWRWNPTSARWEVPTDLGSNTVTSDPFDAGTSWFYALDGDGSYITKSVQGTQVDTSTSFSVPLKVGWNLICNPFDFSVAWSDSSIKIKYGAWEGTPTQAKVYGWVDNRAMWYDSDQEAYVIRYSNEAIPYVMPKTIGQWLYSAVDSAYVVFPPTEYTSSAAPTSKSETDLALWKVKLTLKSSKGNDMVEAIADKSERQFKLRDMKPPSLPIAGPRISFIKDNNELSSDWQVESRDMIWTLEIKSPSESSLVWNLIDVPENYSITIEDPQTGKQMDMRKMSGTSISEGESRYILKATKYIRRLVRKRGT